MLIEMLQYHHENDSEKTCEWCLEDLTTHADGDASHLSECGPIPNLIAWLCGPLLQLTHGGRKPRPTPRASGTDGDRLPQKRPAAEASTGSTGHSIMAAFKRQGLGEHPKGAATDGQFADSSRSRLGSHSKSDMLHPVPPLGPGWTDPNAHSAITGMEEEQEHGRGSTSETAPADPHSYHPAGKSAEDQQLQTAGPATDCQREVSSNLRGQSWPFLQWCHQKKALRINAKQPAIAMEEMLTSLTELLETCKGDQAVVRFHAAKAMSSQEPVIPWKLDLDVKNLPLHQMIHKLAQSSVWQLVSLRMKPHSLSQGRLADQLQQMFPSRSKRTN